MNCVDNCQTKNNKKRTNPKICPFFPKIVGQSVRNYPFSISLLVQFAWIYAILIVEALREIGGI